MSEAITNQAGRRILFDGSASEWLKQTLQSALERDPVDALNDVLTLADVLESRLRTELDTHGDS
jgi:hypothetical protein